MNTKSVLPFSDHIAPDATADLEAVIAAIVAGKPVDPDLQKRVREEADRIREAVYRKHGILDIGVPAIRELRDE